MRLEPYDGGLEGAIGLAAVVALAGACSLVLWYLV